MALIEPLERARAGDTAAYRSIVDRWSDPSFRLAWLLTGDRARAASALADAFVGCWEALPSLHTRSAFRPWLYSTVIDAARARGFGPVDGTFGALADAEDGVRTTAALRYGIGLKLGEIAQASIEPLREVRKEWSAARDAFGGIDDEQIVRAVRDDMRGLEVDGAFFDAVLAPRLTRSPAASVVRTITRPVNDITTLARSVAAMGALTGLSLRGPERVEPGAHWVARGVIPGLRTARIELVATRTDGVLTWVERATSVLPPASTELRFSLTWQGDDAETRATLSLDGIAARAIVGDHGAGLADELRQPMHGWLEAFAAKAGRPAPL